MKFRLPFLADRVATSAMTDEEKLNQLGYKQELKRKLTYFHNWAIAFSYLSPITGLTGTYGYSMSYGGPVTIIWGWVIVSAMNLCLSLVMAEIVSAYPTSGGVYFFSHRLAGRKYGAICSWFAGWFNLLGGAAATGGVAFTTAQLIANYSLLATGTAIGGGYLAPQSVLLGIYAGVLFFEGLVNAAAAQGLAVIGNMSVWFHCVGLAVFTILLPCVAPKHQSASYVFTEFVPDNGAYAGIHNNGFLFLLGLLGSQWAMVGYDTAAHMVEETQGADTSGPISMIGTVVGGFFMGITFLISVTFSIQDPATIYNYVGGVTDSVAGNSVFGIVYQAFKARYHTSIGAMLLMLIPTICSVFCGTACVTANSRMIFAFSRDGGIPASNLWRKVYWGSPANAVWLAVFLAFILGLPMLNNYTAFAAITSVGVVGLYISYAIPVFFHAFADRSKNADWTPGPFNLGRWSKPLSYISSAWICLACVLFVLPQVYPVTVKNLNYAPVTVGCVLILAGSIWIISARKWFKGPVGDMEFVASQDVEGTTAEVLKDALPKY